jgi:hypothetical protein
MSGITFNQIASPTAKKITKLKDSLQNGQKYLQTIYQMGLTYKIYKVEV